MKKSLKVGILLSSLEVTNWVMLIIQSILKKDFLQVFQIILPQQHIELSWKNVLYRMYTKLDYKFFLSENDLFAQKNIEDIVKDIPKIDIGGVAGLDIVLILNGPIKYSNAFAIPKYGIWGFEHDINNNYFQNTSFFKELFIGNELNKIQLIAWKGEDSNSKVLYKGCSSNALNFFSLYKNKYHNFSKMPQIVLNSLQRMSESGEYGVWSEGIKNPSAQSYEIPKNFQMILFFGKLLWRIFGSIWKKAVFNERWFIAVTKKIKSDNEWDISSFKTIVNPLKRYLADPMLVTYQGLDYLFVEDFFCDKNKGVLAVLKRENDGSFSEPKTILERPYHLSYPFVFEWQDQMYMIPETAQHKTVELYKAVSFPFEWKFEMNLFENLAARDATILEYQNKIWLFMNIDPYAKVGTDDLYIYYSDSLFGPWISHPKNPVVSDVRHARPAGHLFYNEDGELIRPAQDCSKDYGYAISLCKVEQLSETEYKEIVIKKIEPHVLGKKNRCIHTLNFLNDLQVMDGKKLEWKFKIF